MTWIYASVLSDPFLRWAALLLTSFLVVISQCATFQRSLWHLRCASLASGYTNVLMYLAGEEGLKVNWPVELRSQSKEEVVFHEPHKVSVILTTTYLRSFERLSDAPGGPLRNVSSRISFVREGTWCASLMHRLCGMARGTAKPTIWCKKLQSE